MSYPRRALIALILLLAIPLRTLAAVAMPCCPVDGSTHAMASMDDGAMSADPLAGSDHPHDDAPTAPVACFAVAMIATPAFSLTVLPTLPSMRVDLFVDPSSSFITDVPERPPREPAVAA